MAGTMDVVKKFRENRTPMLVGEIRLVHKVTISHEEGKLLWILE